VSSFTHNRSFQEMGLYRQSLALVLEWKPLQQFWLLTEPMGIARNLSIGEIVKF